MNKTILATYSDIDYVLVFWPENTYTPFVAAWGYNPETETWRQGHYFCTIDGAVDYIRDKRETRLPSWKTYDRMAEIASTAISYLYDNGLLLDYLDDRYIELTTEEREFFLDEDEDEDDDDDDDDCQYLERELSW